MQSLWHNQKYQTGMTWLLAFALGFNLALIPLQMEHGTLWWGRVLLLVGLGFLNAAILLRVFLAAPHSSGDRPRR
jgi:hypothetical protein